MTWSHVFLVCRLQLRIVRRARNYSQNFKMESGILHFGNSEIPYSLTKMWREEQTAPLLIKAWCLFYHLNSQEQRQIDWKTTGHTCTLQTFARFYP